MIHRRKLTALFDRLDEIDRRLKTIRAALEVERKVNARLRFGLFDRRCYHDDGDSRAYEDVAVNVVELTQSEATLAARHVCELWESDRAQIVRTLREHGVSVEGDE